MERAELVAVCDREVARAEQAGVAAYSDLTSMLSDHAPDLLDIILPPDAQAEAIRMALARGIPWIVCQKPFCRSLDEAQALTAEAREAGAKLVVHENFRFQPWYRAIRGAIADGAIGRVRQATFRLRPGDGQGPDAYLDRQPYFQRMERFLVHETAVHWIDTFRFLLGDPLAVYADLRRVNPVISGEDAGYVLFDHPGGVRALFDGNRSLDHATDNLRRTMGEALIEGDEGTLTLNGDGSVLLRPFGNPESRVILGSDTHGGFGGDCVHRLQTHVVLGILEGAPLENLADDYLTVIEIEEAIYSSAAEGRKIRLGKYRG
jgi:predicted dehydrogenase